MVGTGLTDVDVVGNKQDRRLTLAFLRVSQTELSRGEEDE